MHAFDVSITHPVRQIGTRVFDFRRQVAVMAIVNRTPDSFFDDGETYALDRAVERALQHEARGADWVDIGGIPFGPGPEVSEAEEQDRIIPLIRAMRERSDMPISVDTYRPAVALAALEAGANIINDTTGLHDEGMIPVVAAHPLAQIVITHSLANPPRSVVPSPQYDNVTAEVLAFLREASQRALAGGVGPEQIIVDPGHDLNKNTLHTLQITRELRDLTDLGYPVLAAVSNKDFIGESLDRPKAERGPGSIASATVAALHGARVIRMHDALAGADAMKMVAAIAGWREPAYLKHNMSDRNE